MSDFASGSNPQIDPSPDPASNSEQGVRNHVIHLARDSAGGLVLRLLSGKHSALIVMLLVLALPVGAVIVWFAARPGGLRKSPTAGTASGIRSLLLTQGTKPKPAPGKPMIAAVPSAPLPPLTTPVSPSAPALQTSVAPQIAPQINASNAAPAPIVGSVPPAPPPAFPAASSYPPMVYQARHDKAFGGGCSGQLTLGPSGLDFNCVEDPHASMRIALNEIGAADENGVRLLSGKKYHFSIRGMTKSGEETLFVNWLHQVR